MANDLDARKEMLDRKLGERVLAGDYDGIVEIERELKRLAAERFADKARTLKAEIDAGIERRATLERDLEIADDLRKQKAEIYHETLETARMAQIDLNQCSVAIFGIQGALENTRENVRKLRGELEKMLVDRFRKENRGKLDNELEKFK